MIETNKINLDGLDNALIEGVKGSYDLLTAKGDVSVVTAEEEIKQLLAEFADSRINVFDGHTAFQNIIKLNGLFFIQLRKQKFYYKGNGNGMVREYTNDYELSTIGYKRLQNDYGKLSIEPGNVEIPFLTKLLSHIFSSDEVFISGHENFNAKYNVCATDKAWADSLLSDSVLDLISNSDNIVLSIVHDKFVIWYPKIDQNATQTLLTIFDTMRI